MPVDARSYVTSLLRISVLQENPRFASYCKPVGEPQDQHECLTTPGPFCQISSAPSSIPCGLRDPPAYSPPPSPRPSYATLATTEEPPPYTSAPLLEKISEKGPDSQPAEDVLHFLNPATDSIPSLSLRYGVPQDALRKSNGLFANNLLAARRTILIPGEFYKGGVSLSPTPIEGEEEEIRKGKVRRWMVACKVAE